ncbi:hypothetical protein ACSNOU_14750 [Acinetobacter oleivorans]|uniref:hypothetical protein n=1 Tax=Acinetobacter oleivorans TaxID=1148157 RepID=UPI003F1E3BF9
MNNIFCKQHFFYKILILGCITCIANSAVAMDCQVANQLSTSIYKRAYDAYNKGDLKVAYAHKDDFWDIAKYGQNCEKVKETAEKFIKTNMGKNTKAPNEANSTITSDSTIPSKSGTTTLPSGIQKLCLNTYGCTITVQGNGGGNIHGYEIQKVYEFSQSGSHKNIIEWKQLTSKDSKKIFEQDFRKMKTPVAESQEIHKLPEQYMHIKSDN